SVYFTDSNIGWVVGQDVNAFSGLILKTTNGGANWTPQTINLIPSLQSVYFINSNTGFAVGMDFSASGGSILRTTDGGLNWTPQAGPNSYILNSIFFTDQNTGWAVGGNTILKTINGGTSWDTQISNLTGGESLYGVNFTNLNNGWAVGSYGTIITTANGGATWTSQESRTGYDLSSVYFTDSNTGWAVGRNGTILHTTNGGATFIEEEKIDKVPTEFLLSQNYPNPFNPSTKISWQSPVGSWQTLKIYDVLGKEVATLVNEEKPAGNYEVNWNASNLSSGVYMYKLQTGNFVETKKMILIK
ncbi:MAG: YCF48-related protein, partial [Ignavibacteria bacterium]|nr:YCF48-related protein [Ignavibacteria bacterium]